MTVLLGDKSFRFGGQWFLDLSSRQVAVARSGRLLVGIRSPRMRPLWSERNRIHCSVVPLGRGFRLVVCRWPKTRWEKQTEGGKT